jgi:phenylalanyl-tRNA synthetase beta chain
MSGSRWGPTWNLPKELASVDFYVAKGAVEALARELRLPPLAWTRSEHPALHPGRAADVRAGGVPLGAVGQLHPQVAEALDLPGATLLFELDAQTLLELAAADHRYEPPSRYPALTRDINVDVPREIPAEAVRAVMAREAGELGRVIRLFDLYSGRPLPDDRVRLTFSLELAADDRTLTDSEADQLLARLREALTDECAAEFR